MARSIATIQSTMLANIAADPILGGVLTSPSQTAIYRLLTYIFAVATNLAEQVRDMFITQCEILAEQTPAAALNWIASQAFLYQYDPSGSSTTNALTILPNGSLGYATINPAFNIVTRCAAILTGNNSVQIKVAQDIAVGIPGQITGTAFTQLQGYFDAKGTAGINYTVTSGVSDKIAIGGTVYYKPGYAGVAQTNVEAALNNYINNIAIYSIGSQEPINYAGQIKVSDIISVIQNTEGVDDFKLTNLWGRADGTPFANATVIYDLVNGIDNRSYDLAAGYGVEENTTGKDWGTLIKYLSA